MKSRSWIIDLAGLVTIVGTIIGASWVSQSITNARIDGLENSLNARIDGLEKSTTASIDGLEKSTTASIDGLQKSTNARIDGLQKSTNARIDGLETTLDARIGGLEKRVGVMEGSLEDLRDDIRELSAALYRVITNQVAQLGSGLEGGDSAFAPPPERSEE